jgi:hypothetical protein
LFWHTCTIMLFEGEQRVAPMELHLMSGSTTQEPPSHILSAGQRLLLPHVPSELHAW